MSGITGSKLNIRGSGRIAKLGTDGQALTSAGAGMAAAFEDVVGGLSWQAVETGSTMTAVAGNGYWIDTTSNACTITLPATASNGDEIMFADYARTWGTNGIILDSNGLNYQGEDDTYRNIYPVEYETDGTALHIVYSGATNGWIPTLNKTVADVPSKGNQEGIFGFGNTNNSNVSTTNLVSNAGVVSTDVAALGSANQSLMATEYGGDKGIFGFGYVSGPISRTNLVSNAGVVATDTTGVGTARYGGGACGYGGDKGIFGFGTNDGSVYTAITNLVSNAGVVATDQAATTGTGRINTVATEYGGDKGIFFGGYIHVTYGVSMTNLVSNAGVVSSDVAGVGTARSALAACSYGGDKGIFGFGWNDSSVVSMTNLISNAGVVATDVAGVGTARRYFPATQYGGDKGIFGFGTTGGKWDTVGMTNLVSNTGVVATDVSAVGTDRYSLAACSFN